MKLSPKTNSWWRFQAHRLVCVECAHTKYGVYVVSGIAIFGALLMLGHAG